jgi:hypothetical protein
MEFGSPENTNCAQFSVCIDQSVLDDLPPLDDIDSDFSDDDSCSTSSEDTSDDDSCSSSSEDTSDDDSCSSNSEDTSIGSDNLSYASYLSIIYEETEEDLLSLIGDNDADNESFCRITVPRSISVDSYLAKNQRRSQEQTIDLTLHVTRRSSKHFDNDSVASYAECAEDEQQQERTALDRSPQHETVDCKSVGSSSSASSFNFKIAQRRLQRNLSARNLRQALHRTSTGVNEDSRSSFRIDQQKSDCFIKMTQSLLESPPPKRSGKAYEQARNKLLNAMTSAASLHGKTIGMMHHGMFLL